MPKPATSTLRDEYGSPVLAALPESNRDAWASFVDHEFAHALGEGTLPCASFLHCPRQDNVLSLRFSWRWVLAVAKRASSGVWAWMRASSRARRSHPSRSARHGPGDSMLAHDRPSKHRRYA